jgi:lipoprotein-anchoring transpeptidase ErfK/SrfK
MFNQDVIDLFQEIPTGTKVIVRSEADSLRMEGPMAETPEGYVEPTAQTQTAALAPDTAAFTNASQPASDPYASMPMTSTDTSQVTDPYATTNASFVSPVESAVTGQ